MSTLKGVISDIRTFLYGGFATLPLTIAGTLLVLGLMTANYAMLFLLVGLIIVFSYMDSLIGLIYKMQILREVEIYSLFCNLSMMMEH
jgi:hypothetical protein